MHGLRRARQPGTGSVLGVALPELRKPLRERPSDFLGHLLARPLLLREMRDRPVVAETLLGPGQVVVSRYVGGHPVAGDLGIFLARAVAQRLLDPVQEGQEVAGEYRRTEPEPRRGA